MKILIYGAGYMGKTAFELMQSDYGIGNKILGFIDKNKEGQYLGYPIYKIDEMKNFPGIVVIALSDFEIAKSVCQSLKENAYSYIFWFQNKRRIIKFEDFLIEQCVNCKEWEDDMLPQVEMHIIDSCNLNCRGCAHFSPIFPNTLPDIQSRLKDVECLKSKISHIMKFYILGGEPFLNPDINSYIYGIRKILPYSQIYIVTNGLLIEKLSEKVFKSIKENQVWVSISEYHPTHKKIEEICKILKKYRILYEIRENKYKKKFNIPLSLNDNSKYPRTCISNGCITIWNSMIARCPQLMYISYFNKYFKTQLPEEGIIELGNCESGQELIDRLQQEVPLCKHCISKEIDWSICGKRAKLEDFAVND